MKLQIIGFEDIILEETLPAALDLLKEKGIFIAVDRIGEWRFKWD